MDGITNSMDKNLSKLRETVEAGKPGVLQSMKSQRVGHNLAAEQQEWTGPLHFSPPVPFQLCPDCLMKVWRWQIWW